jgi:hypothetical protein
VTAFSYCCIYAFRLHDQTENVLYGMLNVQGSNNLLASIFDSQLS